MKVAFLHFYTFRLLRGIETLIVSFANQLVAKGVEVSILAARGTLERTLIPVDQRVQVKQFPTVRYYEHFTVVPWYVWDLIRNHYDIVNIFFADFGEAAALRLASRFVDFRLNLYFCYPLDAVPHRFKSFTKCHLDKMATLFLGDSSYVAEGVEAFFHRPCIVVPVGTDTQRFKPDEAKRAETRAELGIQPDEVVLLNVSELEERKGTGRVVESLPYVREKFPLTRFLILGKGDCRERLEKRVEELRLTPWVNFLGTTTELPRFYNAADIFVMVPDKEANSIACHEAMACGLPVIVSNSGGFQEVVDDTCGRIVNAQSRDEIVGAILELAASGMLREQLGSQGRKRIEERLTWDVQSDRLLEVFRKELES